jgi:hypothetical protein
MIELYAFLTLMSLGYIMSKQKKTMPQVFSNNKINPNDNPSQNTVYDSSYAQQVHRMEHEKAAEMFTKSYNPRNTGVINRSYRDGAATKKKKIKSELSGMEIDTENIHNNMTPFFGSRVKQNLKHGANRSILENFTGEFTKDIYKQKKEIGPMFPNRGNIEDVVGSRVNVEKFLDRYNPSHIRNNEKPFSSVRVGPGLNQDGFGMDPVGGFQQYDRDFMMPKTVDDLRVATNPKETFGGRVLPGQGIPQRGNAGTVYKNRPSITEERTGTSRMFVTASGIEQATLRPDVIENKETQRATTNQEYFGDAFANTRMPLDGQVKDSSRQQLEEFGMRNLDGDEYGKGAEFDHGKDSIDLPAQERDATSQRTHQSNLTSLVKSIIAPLEDIMRINKKEYLINNGRPYGELQAQAPSRTTYKDPNNVMRTTIRETLDDKHDGSMLTGPTKLTVYDPEDIARRTTRETVQTEARKGNVQTMAGEKGGYMSNEYKAKQTAREFLDDHDYIGTAGAVNAKRQMNYEEFYNSDINVLKESTLKGRAPVYEGAKTAVHSDQVFMTTRKLEMDEEANRMYNNIENINGEVIDSEALNLTKTKDPLKQDNDRLDPTVLSSLESNPFALKPLACMA